MNPRDRVRIVIETARAVIDGRLDTGAALATLRVQQDQISPFLRGDRIDVTQTEANEVALTLRRLAEQVSERAEGTSDHEDHVAIAQIIGELAQILR
ncbi:MAG: hypothetical protein JST73_08365 [Actinobacteria bacterium]|nr:hypothetical protein [Actinomycetota bacterium]